MADVPVAKRATAAWRHILQAASHREVRWVRVDVGAAELRREGCPRLARRCRQQAVEPAGHLT
jgi:hypothetical protein